MLRSQGWEPGQYLGSKDATHTQYHSEASASHIRVVLKDDMLGLGAKRNNGDECTGLDAFQHLLGRLNGKTEEALETEQRARDDLKLNLYLDRKVGMIRFVPGGFLVGDVVKEKLDGDSADPSDNAAQAAYKEPAEESTEAEPTEKKSKKRKAERDNDRDQEKARKREKKSKRRKTECDAETDSENPKDKKKKKDKKDKKEKKSNKPKEDSNEVELEPPVAAKSKSKRKKDKDQEADAESSDERDTSVDDAKKAKEKKAKKEKKEKKEKKKREKAASESEGESQESTSEKKRRKEGSTQDESGISTPSGSGYSTPVTTSTRYLARSRFIAQKKMAFADSAALNQVKLW